MKIGITGGRGFIGWHLRCYLRTLGDSVKVKVADRNTFSEESSVEDFVTDVDCIIHLAGVNRADSSVLIDGNIDPAKKLVAALFKTKNNPCIIYSSSTYAEDPDNIYGQAKAEVHDILFSWANQTGSRLVNMVIPHVFGEYGRPFYNSAVATFCHSIVMGEDLKINKDGNLELIHVQDLAEKFISAYQNGLNGLVRIEGHHISVEDAACLLKSLHDKYVVNKQLPDLSSEFCRNMFNSLRGSIEYSQRLFTTAKYSDDRGWLVETIKAGSSGQCFVSTTKPGITRGNHFHRRKVERFFVLKGIAEVKLRKLYTDEVVSYTIDGRNATYIDIPTLHTHSITNIGKEELMTLFWADEFYEENNSDTYFEHVEANDDEGLNE